MDSFDQDKASPQHGMDIAYLGDGKRSQNSFLKINNINNKTQKHN